LSNNPSQYQFKHPCHKSPYRKGLTKYTRPDSNGGPFAPEFSEMVSMEQILSGKSIIEKGLPIKIWQTD